MDSSSSTRLWVIFYELHSRKLPVALLLSIEPRCLFYFSMDRQTTRRFWSIYHPNLVAIPLSSISPIAFLPLPPLLCLSTLSGLTQNWPWQFNVSFVSGSLSIAVYFCNPLLVPTIEEGWLVGGLVSLSLIRCEFSGRQRWSFHGCYVHLSSCSTPVWPIW